MRAPSPSFKAELAACRQMLMLKQKNHRQLSFMLKILDRWAGHPSAEDIWNTISSNWPRNALRSAYSDDEFILDVLASAVWAKKLKPVVYELDNCETKTLAHNKRLIGHKRYSESADLMKLLAEVREGRRRLLSREKKTAARNYFMIGWQEKFITMCGQPLIDVVRVLTDIAFGGEVPVEAVRGARKPTTREARRPKSRERDTRPPK
jgi:hypothetical protein